MSVARHHAEWRSLVEVSGPFLAMDVLLRVFPQGLDKPDDERDVRERLRLALEEWQGASGEAAIHRAFVRFVLGEVLGFEGELLVEGQGLAASLAVVVAEQGETLRPDLALVEAGSAGSGKARLLIGIVPPGQGLERALPGRRWNASPATRMAALIQGSGVRLGLLTNGEHWMLVHGASGETTTFASFYASLWLEEPLTLRAFRSLLGAHRFFSVGEKETLVGLFADSAKNQHEVTDQLGYQVRRAVEVLVQAIDRIDRERDRKLLRNFSEQQLYEAAVTVMMRLVFLLAAEEKGMFPLGVLEIYDRHYAVSTLREQLREVADRRGEEVLERRHDAWSRLLTIVRAVHGGVQHDALRLPAYGGSLFDPDRFPFLEGREAGTKWRDAAASPLPIHNRTVLHLLDALQILQIKVPGGGPSEAQRLSFRALNVEQIGHVYEGLLDHTALRAKGAVLGMVGTKDKEPEIPVDELDTAKMKGEAVLIELLRDKTGRSESALKKAIAYALPKDDQRLITVCENRAVYGQVAPYAALLREDSSGYPVVYGKGSLYVTQGSDRRSTGTHYTPQSLTEPIVQYTLEPLVYEGPAEGKSKGEWKLRTAREILGLRVCDMAMGSGAFLVQACRYMADRVVEAWGEAEKVSGGVPLVIPMVDPTTGQAAERILPRDVEERLVLARRIVADRCLYGVDKNPMAVEIAKLSLWLTTMQKDRPFTFLDHALRCGDSLLGLTQVEQLERFHMDPKVGTTLPLGADVFRKALGVALEKRRRLESFTVDTIQHAAQKEMLLKDAEAATAEVKVVADLIVGAALATAGKRKEALDEELRDLGVVVAGAFDKKTTEEVRAGRVKNLKKRASEMLGEGRTPFHWVLEFPEIFVVKDETRRGFDAVIGNPPFQGGTVASKALSEAYMKALQEWMPPWHGKADLVVGFFKKAVRLVQSSGVICLVATSALLRGETLESGLAPLVEEGRVIFYAKPPYMWPGTANVEVVNVGLCFAWTGTCNLDGKDVAGIAPDLVAGTSVGADPLEIEGSLCAFMGLKLSPTNRDMPLTTLEGVPPIVRDLFVPALGGEELYGLTDVRMAPVVVDPDRLEQFDRKQLKGNSAQAVARVLDLDALQSYKHSRPAEELGRVLARSNLAFACGETSVHLAFVSVPVGAVILRHKLIVFPSDSWSTFSVVQSSFHHHWAWQWGLRREARLVYSAKRCARTYPSPLVSGIESPAITRLLSKLGQNYHTHRQSIMQARQEGLTKTYNRFHNPDEPGKDIAALRALHVEMDQAVAKAYGWEDLPLEHGFHETKQGTRYTISERARRDVLGRLLRLNHERYAEEVAQGLHDKDKGKAKAKGKAEPAAVKGKAKADKAPTLAEKKQKGWDF